MDYTIKHLVKALVKAGVIKKQSNYHSTRMSIQHWITDGLLQLRRNPHNKYYVVNEDEIEQIVKEFKPGGQGFWHANI